MVALGSALAAVSITAAALFGAGLRDAVCFIHEGDSAEEVLSEEASAANGAGGNVQSEKAGPCDNDPRLGHNTEWLVLVLVCLLSFVGGIIVGCLCCPSQCIGHGQRIRNRSVQGPAPASQTQPGWKTGQSELGNLGKIECESVMPPYDRCVNYAKVGKRHEMGNWRR